MSEHRATVPAWHPAAYWKAVAPFIAAGVALLVVPMLAGNPPGWDDVWKAVGTMLSVAAAAYLAPKNRPTEEVEQHG